MAQELDDIIAGRCCGCDADITTAGSNHTHFLGLDNGSMMRIAVDVDCKALLVDEKKQQKTADDILKTHKKHWVKHTEGCPPEWLLLKVTDPDADYAKKQKEIRDQKAKK